MRELVVLGTASQVPTRTRNHNGYLLLWDGQGLLFDPGEGTQRQLTLAGVPASRITTICLTHVHGDHCYGLPGVLARLALDRVQHRIDLYYPASGDDEVAHLVAVAHANLDLHLHPHGGGDIAEGLVARPLRHRVETYGYRWAERPGRTMVPERLARARISGPAIRQLLREGRLGGVRLEDVSEPRPGQRFAIVMDTAPCPGAEELAEDADLLLAEATFADEDVALAEAHLHLTAGAAGVLAASSGARRLVMTHFSGRYPKIAPLLEQARARSGGVGVEAASDLDRYTLPSRRGWEIESPGSREETPDPDQSPGPPRQDRASTCLVVDAANVIGSVPDGWWRDRAGAAARLHSGLETVELPFDRVVLVLEGLARAGVPAGTENGITTVHAPADGDDQIVSTCRELVGEGAAVSLVTSDRGLLSRVAPLGVPAVSPRSLRATIGDTEGGRQG